jgi:cell division septation protein DedD
MTIKDLQKKVAEVLGVSSSEKELAYEIFISKINDVLTNNVTLKVPKIGFFQLRFEENETEVNSLIFSPLSEDFIKDSRTLYLSIELPSRIKFQKEVDSTVFSIGVNKPLIPLSDDVSIYTESETSYAILKKSIEERVNEIIVESEYLPGFNIWDDYFKTIEEDNKSDKSALQFAELTSDIEFKDDKIAEEITNNLLGIEIPEFDQESEEPEIKTDEILPSDLLDDYRNVIEESLEESKTQDLFVEETELQASELIEEIKEVQQQKEEPVEEKIEADGQKDIEFIFPMDSKRKLTLTKKFIKSKDEEKPTEIVSEHELNKLLEKYDDDLDMEDQIENEILEDEIVEDKIGTKERIESLLEDDESYLGLKKKIEEINWDWGDELKEEFGTGIIEDKKEIVEFEEENDLETPKVSTHEIFKTTKPIGSQLFQQLETKIKKEFEEAEKEVQYIDYYGPPPRYEFVEDRNYRSHDWHTSSYRPTNFTTYEEFNQSVGFKKPKENYFNKIFLLLFSAFVISISIIIYFFLPYGNSKPDSKSVSEPITENLITNSSEQDLSPQEQNITFEEESDFPRVATLPVTDSNKLQNQEQTSSSNIQKESPPVIEKPSSNVRTNSTNPLYKVLPVDTRVGKTIYFDGSSFNIQVSSWRNKLKAEQEAIRLKNMGHDAFLVEAYLPQKGGMWYRVRIGSFSSREAAEQFIIKNNF